MYYSYGVSATNQGFLFNGYKYLFSAGPISRSVLAVRVA